MLSLACRDVGIKNCDYVTSGETEEELWKNGAEHIIKVHGTEDADITPQFKESYKRYIKHS
jgi:predicted small metal-binding protein